MDFRKVYKECVFIEYMSEEDDKPSNEGDETGEEDNSSDTLFERTDKATARIEAANAKTEELLNRQEELYAKQKLGGKSRAGQVSKPEPSEEEKKKGQASDFFAGTALGDAIDKT